ncbi:hypothetical protein [Rubripirellula obstinata]|nr:hypothetical protein [Rubripirellula obstinata]
MHPREIISLARHRIRQIIDWSQGHPDWLHVPKIGMWAQPVVWVGKRGAVRRFDSLADGAEWAKVRRRTVIDGLFTGSAQSGRTGSAGHWMLDDMRTT